MPDRRYTSDRRPEDLRGATLAILAGSAIGALVPLALTRVAVASWTLRDIERQLGEAKRQGWTKHFADAGDKFGFSSATLLSIASRETNIKNIIRDGGHGYGIMQIDDRSYPEIWRLERPAKKHLQRCRSSR